MKQVYGIIWIILQSKSPELHQSMFQIWRSEFQVLVIQNISTLVNWVNQFLSHVYHTTTVLPHSLWTSDSSRTNGFWISKLFLKYVSSKSHMKDSFLILWISVFPLGSLWYRHFCYLCPVLGDLHIRNESVKIFFSLWLQPSFMV